MVDQKRAELDRAHRLETFRLSMMERDLGAIQAKLDPLHREADSTERERPQEAQSFLRHLDHLQVWLTATQRQVASEDEPQSLAEAEQLLNQHAAIREEIDGYTEDYKKMRAMGDATQDQTDPQYVRLAHIKLHVKKTMKKAQVPPTVFGWSSRRLGRAAANVRQPSATQPGTQPTDVPSRYKTSRGHAISTREVSYQRRTSKHLKQAEHMLKRDQDFMTICML
ncbi:unnamed protein product [Cylicocyclus nassatus]|uniref:Uncharacterized protein n=1 Tax=Cylicocyclus nassatus TaxID=53992 RepID=A0AA36M6V3_CYLNA|nr:unnamed protein product [Cylicocyclus nassatus]